MRNVAGHTNWNSTRHYAWKHAEREHGLTHSFQGAVKDSWRDAKAQIAQGAQKVYVDGDKDTPAYTLQRIA